MVFRSWAWPRNRRSEAMKTTLAFVAMISFTVAANLLLKLAATSAAVSASPWALVTSWRFFAGLTCFGCAAVLYAVILRWLPLNVAQSFAAAQFIAVVLASAIVLAEPIGLITWIGIVLIAVGIAIVGWSTF